MKTINKNKKFGVPKKIEGQKCTVWDKSTEAWITQQVTEIIDNLIEKGFNPSSGTADQFFRIYNRFCFKVNKKRSAEPTSNQRAFIEYKYPLIFPKNLKGGKIKNG